MIKQEQVNELKALIESHDHIAVFHHVNPDGDCIASSFGFATSLREQYPNKDIKVVANIEDFTPHLRYMDEYINWEETIKEPEHDDYLFIIGDTSVGTRVRHLDKFLGKSDAIFCYDHHENELTIDNVDVFWIEPDYSAAGLMAYELVNALEIKMSPEAALIINHGILTDTGFYRFAPGDKTTIMASAEMNEIIGAEKQKQLYRDMSTKTSNELKFQGWVLANYKVVDDKVAYATISKEVIDRFGFVPDQAARVNFLQGIEGIEAWIFFIQYEDFVRTEFRSYNIWVNEIATEFGGGGHKNASGCHLKTMEEHEAVVARVVEEVNK